MLDDLAFSLAKTGNRLCARESDSPFAARHDSVVILIDEADSATPELDLGTCQRCPGPNLQSTPTTSRSVLELLGTPEAITETLRAGRLRIGTRRGTGSPLRTGARRPEGADGERSGNDRKSHSHQCV